MNTANQTVAFYTIDILKHNLTFIHKQKKKYQLVFAQTVHELSPCFIQKACRYYLMICILKIQKYIKIYYNTYNKCVLKWKDLNLYMIEVPVIDYLKLDAYSFSFHFYLILLRY